MCVSDTKSRNISNSQGDVNTGNRWFSPRQKPGSRT